MSLIEVAADDLTLEYYNQNAISYDLRTSSLALHRPWSEFTSRVPQGGSILDIGCGPGRDIAYFLSLGFEVDGVEPAKEVAAIARTRTKTVIYECTAENLHINKFYDGVWACASLLHVAPPNMSKVLSLVSDRLKRNGVFYFSVKRGEGEVRKPDGRLFYNYRQSELVSIIANQLELVVVDSWESASSDISEKMIWLNFIVAKR
ncbi:class I SAM-dependent methyltransferase [Pseudomonas sp. K2I15]|uniref:class I SAM-dependent DNA methyltransferase n=1 Tax=Pseudomonas sp. K2I15 TaxID=2013577 RepID=UPI001595BAF9|nr:class I SAM-dependent methyltransferase [Pseudomonas sp. K2I15]